MWVLGLRYGRRDGSMLRAPSARPLCLLRDVVDLRGACAVRAQVLPVVHNERPRLAMYE